MMVVRLEIEIIFSLSYDKFFSNIGPSGNKVLVSQLDE